MRLLFEQSKETASLIGYFRSMPIDAPASFADVSGFVGFRVHASLSAYQSARNIVRKERIVIEGIRGFGFKRLTAIDTVHRGDRHLSSIRRKARVMSTELSGAMMSNLPKAEFVKATELIGRAGILIATASPYVTNRAVLPEIPLAPRTTTEQSAAFLKGTAQ